MKSDPDSILKSESHHGADAIERDKRAIEISNAAARSAEQWRYVWQEWHELCLHDRTEETLTPALEEIYLEIERRGLLKNVHTLDQTFDSATFYDDRERQSSRVILCALIAILNGTSVSEMVGKLVNYDTVCMHDVSAIRDALAAGAWPSADQQLPTTEKGKTGNAGGDQQPSAKAKRKNPDEIKVTAYGLIAERFESGQRFGSRRELAEAVGCSPTGKAITEVWEGHRKTHCRSGSRRHNRPRSPGQAASLGPWSL